MKNPWLELPEESPYIVPADLGLVEEHNRTVKAEHYRVQSNIIPQAFIGSPESKVYILALNPGFCSVDISEIGNTSLAAIKRATLRHAVSNESYPFYPLNPELENTSTADWWLRKLKRLISDVGRQKISRELFCVEYFGYHSTKYGGKIARSSSNILESQKYAGYLVANAISEGKHVVLMRSSRYWYPLVPSMVEYENLHVLNNPQNPAVSPRNLDSYERLVAAFDNTGPELR